MASLKKVVGHKRKRVIQDTPVDLSKMRVAMELLDSLEEELSGIKETEVEMDALMEHAKSLQNILENAKKTVRSFFSTFAPSRTNSLPI